MIEVIRRQKKKLPPYGVTRVFVIAFVVLMVWLLTGCSSSPWDSMPWGKAQQAAGKNPTSPY